MVSQAMAVFHSGSSIPIAGLAVLSHFLSTVVVAGQVQVGRRETVALGVESAYAVAERPDDVERSLADPAGTLAERTARVARTWSR